jgi:hypothetical protein
MGTTKRLPFYRKKSKKKRCNKTRGIAILPCRKNRSISRDRKNWKDSVGSTTTIWINRRGTSKRRCMLI